MTPSRSRPPFPPLMARLPVALLAALLLTACGAENAAPEVAVPSVSTPQGEGDADVYRALMPDWDFERCPALAPPKALAPGDRPTAVLRCGTSTALEKGDGEWRYGGTWRATAGLSDLVAALRLPSTERAEGETCIAIALGPYFVVVEIDGAPRVVPAPERACGQPPQELRDAYQSLVWEEASS